MSQKTLTGLTVFMCLGFLVAVYWFAWSHNWFWWPRLQDEISDLQKRVAHLERLERR